MDNDKNHKNLYEDVLKIINIELDKRINKEGSTYDKNKDTHTYNLILARIEEELKAMDVEKFIDYMRFIHKEYEQGKINAKLEIEEKVSNRIELENIRDSLSLLNQQNNK